MVNAMQVLRACATGEARDLAGLHASGRILPASLSACVLRRGAARRPRRRIPASDLIPNATLPGPNCSDDAEAARVDLLLQVAAATETRSGAKKARGRNGPYPVDACLTPVRRT